MSSDRLKGEGAMVIDNGYGKASLNAERMAKEQGVSHSVVQEEYGVRVVKGVPMEGVIVIWHPNGDAQYVN